jgi:hypothetical protein
MERMPATTDIIRPKFQVEPAKGRSRDCVDQRHVQWHDAWYLLDGMEITRGEKSLKDKHKATVYCVAPQWILLNQGRVASWGSVKCPTSIVHVRSLFYDKSTRHCGVIHVIFVDAMGLMLPNLL